MAITAFQKAPLIKFVYVHGHLWQIGPCFYAV